MAEEDIFLNFGERECFCCLSAQSETLSQTEQTPHDEGFGVADGAKGLLNGMATVVVIIIILLPLLIAMDKRSRKRRDYLNSFDEESKVGSAEEKLSGYEESNK